MEKSQSRIATNPTVIIRGKFVLPLLISLLLSTACQLVAIDSPQADGKVEQAASGEDVHLSEEPQASDEDPQDAGVEDASPIPTDENVVQGEMLAFPGAEGFGRLTTGGRGGEVYLVTSMKNSGKGSFSDAVSKPNRIILFTKGGEVNTKNHWSDNLTVFCQTAPGGVAFTRAQYHGNNNIIRGCRFRTTGASAIRDKDNDGKVFDVIVDHCSFSFGSDDTVDWWNNHRQEPVGSQDRQRFTMQWSIISDTFVRKSGSKVTEYGKALKTSSVAKQITFHHILLDHCGDRHPNVVDVSSEVEVIHVVVGRGGSDGKSARHRYEADNHHNLMNPDDPRYGKHPYKPAVHFIKNWARYKSPNRSVDIRIEKRMKVPKGSRFYLKGNRCNNRPNDNQPETDALDLTGKGEGDYSNVEIASQPVFKPSGVTEQATPEAAYELMRDPNQGAGALPHDAIDRHAIERMERLSWEYGSDRDDFPTNRSEYEKKTGVKYPTYGGGSYPEDSDGDGIPDDYAKSRGWDPNRSQASKLETSGFMRIEEYANSLIPIPGK